MSPLLHRAERSLLTGAVAGLISAGVTNSHHHVAAAAAAQHMTEAKYLFHGFLDTGVLVAVVVFAAWSLGAWARNRNSGSRQPARRPYGR